MKKAFLFFAVMLALGRVWANHWEPDPYQFADNMNVVGVIEVNGIEQTSPNLEIGAFCDGECRGSEMLAFYDGLNRYMVFLTLHGESGNAFDFRLYDHASQQELTLTCEQTIQFVANSVVGTIVDPYVFSFVGIAFVIEAQAVPDTAGIVEGAGTYFEGDYCTLKASANTGFSFVNWTENGNLVSSDTLYTFAVVSDRSLTANFAIHTYGITTECEPEEGGAVVGGGVYDYGSMATLEAVPNEAYYFIRWEEDGEMVSTNPTYSFAVERDRHLVAVFAQSCFVVEAFADPETGGTVEGAGNYIEGTTCQLTARSNPGYSFVNWTEDGTEVSTNANYAFVVDGNRSLVAHFEIRQYAINVSVVPSNGGTVDGAGTYTYGETAILTATPNENYIFLKWTENGGLLSEDPTMSIWVNRNRNLVAHFAYYDGLDEAAMPIEVYPNPCDGVLRVDGVEQCDLTLFNTLGQAVLIVKHCVGNQRLDFSTFAKGVYLLQIDSPKGRIVKKVMKR